MPLYKYEEQSTEDKKIAVIVDNFIFFGKRKTEPKKHVVIPSITGAYSETY